MIYFKIGDADYSKYVSALSVLKQNAYNSLVNAKGDTVVDFLNTKRTINVTIIPLDINKLNSLLADLDEFELTLSYLDPKTGQLTENVDVILDNYEVSYYTIQDTKQMVQAFDLSFQEL